MSQTLPKFSRYRVRRGDSLWKISLHAYGRGDLWEGISEANQLKRGRPILAGMDLIIPTARHSIHKTRHGSPTTPQPLAPHHPTALEHPVPTPPPIPAQHAPSHTLSVATKSGPFQPARPVLFPQFKYEFETMVIEHSDPVADYKITMKGEVTLQKEGVITGGLTFTKEGIEAEYKKEADGTFHDLFSKSTAKYGNGKAEVSLAIGSTIRSGGQVLATTEFSLVPPNGIKYSYKGQEIKGTYKGYEFAGVLGYELEIHFKPIERPKAPQLETGHVTYWIKVGGVSLVVLAGVIVIADLAKDVATFGAGTVESPASFAAAALLLGAGMAKIHGTSAKGQPGS